MKYVASGLPAPLYGPMGGLLVNAVSASPEKAGILYTPGIIIRIIRGSVARNSVHAPPSQISMAFNPSILPSSLTAASTNCFCPLPWLVASMFSLLDSVHLIGCSNLVAAKQMVACSAEKLPFWPKLPPMYSTMILTFVSGILRTPAIPSLAENGDWVGIQTVRKPADSS